MEHHHTKKDTVADERKASRRLQATLGHFANDYTTSILETQPCSADVRSDKEKTTVMITSVEYPNTTEVDPRIPSEVYLLPLYTRPIFPNVRISAVPKQLLAPLGNGQPAMDKIKKVIDRLTSENTGTKPFATLNQRKVTSQELTTEARSKKIAYYRGPIVITDRAFTDTLTKLKNGGEKYVALCLAKSSTTPVTRMEDVHSIGVLASIELVDPPNSKQITEVILTGTHRIQVTGPAQSKPFSDNSVPYFRVAVKELKDTAFDKDLPKNRALITAVISQVNELCKLNHPLFKDQLDLISFKIEQREPSELADLCASLSTASGLRLQQILQELNVVERLKKVQTLLSAEIEVCKLVLELKKVNESSPQRRLGGSASGGSERNSKLLTEMKERLKNLNVPEHAQKIIDEEMTKLSSLDPTFNATEHYTCRNYLNWLTNLPWGVYSKDNLDIVTAEKIMEEDHYGMQDVKQRILEFIAVAALKGDMQGKILCFVGPPGTGKTSFGKSIARATKRKFTRFSVGGMHDVSEIKGHRRTYIGAMPGKLIQALKLTRTSNPVILIDEIDKLSRTYDGDPSSALLEVLDPEQNNSFLDHYLDVPYDLSKVLFICTANSLETIPRPLLDRMEIIHLAGYFLDEKVHIAKRHLIPKVMQDSGLKENQITIDDSALHKLIAQYCREAGVRSLQKQLEKLYRKVAMKIAKGEGPQIITADNLEQLLGKPKYKSDRLYDTPPIGVVTGLAYNQLGGSLIWIETVVIHNKKAGIKTTGKLGKVMKESIEIAYTFAKKFMNELDPSNSFFDSANIHIHFPEGATPKDGPSAGCAIVTSLLSLALGRPVKGNLAMTGEISLTGKVLGIGGLKEKVMAAKRSNVTELIVPERNRKDFDELPDQLKQGISANFVEHYNEVYKLVFPHVETALAIAPPPL